MSSVKDHYDRLLGPVYSWTLGDFDSAAARSDALFAELGIQPRGNASAVDLGCGSGAQAIPLARRGFRVTAIDFCDDLLTELDTHAGQLPVRTVHGDIVDFPQFAPGPHELIVCMGDTLVHLPDRDAVSRLLAQAAAALEPGGSLLLSLRDYTTPGPSGNARFIPVRSSDERIFTCFLDYGANVVRVHDLLHRRTADGWTFEVSSYDKLRLGVDWLGDELAAHGLDVMPATGSRGMLVLRGLRR